MATRNKTYHSDKSLITVKEWRCFLKKWSDEWLSTQTKFSTSIRNKRWLGSKPASEDEIEQLEKRLGYRLPPSYRAFLLTTNGWGRTTSFIKRIRPISKVEWLITEDPGLVDILQECGDPRRYEGLSRKKYFSYTAQSMEAYDQEHLKGSLLIADPIRGDSATYLLNPLAVTEDGEWEAWFYASWAGIRRYPSFAHLMTAEYELFRSTALADKSPSYVVGPFSGVYASERPRHKAERIGPGKPLPRRRTIEELVADLENPSAKIRKQTANKLFRECGPHDCEDERPHLVKSALRIINSQLEIEVRCAAADVLGTYGTKAIFKPLAEALGDEPHPHVANSIIHALYYLSLYYKDTVVADAICNYLSVSREQNLQEFIPVRTAISILEEYRDMRLAPIALRILDSKKVEKQLRLGAALALVKVCDKAADEFMVRLTSANPEIREFAVVGVRQTGDQRAIAILEKMVNDPDPDVRKQVETSITWLKSDLKT